MKFKTSEKYIKFKPAYDMNACQTPICLESLCSTT